MKIIIDTYGTDDGIKIPIEGAIEALQERDFIPVFSGDRDEIEKAISSRIEKYEIIDAKEKIENNDDPVRSIRKKRDSSLVKGFEKLNEDQFDGLVSAGSTGAILASGLFISGRIEGVKRACIASSLPTYKNKTILLDTGANMDCKAEFLRDFAIMGSVFAKNVLGIDNPKVALLNVGIEAHKGNKLSKEAYSLLSSQTKLNFIGNMEARDLFTGKTNIIIADGFDGNIAIKTAEGVISLLNKEIKNSIYKSVKTKIAGFLLKDSLKENLSKYNTDDIGGAPLLGINQYVYKAHGNSNVRAFRSAILGLIAYINTNTIEKIKGEIK